MQRKPGMKARLKKGAEGAVSLLLVLAILPLFSVMATVVEAERYQNALRAADEALGSSALSVLSQYDSYLLERFGLLAVKQTGNENFLSSEVKKYVKRQKTTDLVSGAGLPDSTERGDFKVDGVYPLADTDVLRQQVKSYANILAPTKIVLEISELDNIVDQLEEAVGGGFTEMLDLVDSAADMAESSADLYQDYDDAKRTINSFADTVSDYNQKYDKYVNAMNAVKQREAEEPSPPPYAEPQHEPTTLRPTAPTVPTKPTTLEPTAPIVPTMPSGPEITDEEWAAYVDAMNDYYADLDTYNNELDTYNREQTNYSNAVTTYNNDLITYNNDLNAYNREWEEYRTKKSAWETYRTEHQKWENDMRNLRNKAESAKSNYTSAIGSVRSGLDSVSAAVKKANDSRISVTQKGENLIVNAANYEIETTKTESQKTAAENFKTLEESVGKGYTSVADTAKDKLNVLSEDNLASAMRDLFTEEGVAGEADVTHGTMPYNTDSAHQNASGQLGRFTDSSNLTEIMDDMEEQAEENGWFDMVIAMFDVLNSLFNTELIIDGELCATIDTSGIGGLPSKKSYVSNPYEEQDDSSARAFIREIDPNYNPADPYGVKAGTVQSLFEQMIRSLQKVLSYGQEIREAHFILTKFRAIAACLHECYNLFRLFMQLQVALVTLVIKTVYERLLVMSYMVYNLPNRTNYNSEKTLTGYSYAKASLSPRVTGTNIPFLGDIFGTLIGGLSLNKQYSFAGAELEYIIWGNTSEIVNQAGVFFLLYVIRLLADIIPIAMNPEIRHNVEALVGSIIGTPAAVVYLVLILLLEPLLDCYALVNGKSVPIWKKNNDIFLTTQGFPSLIQLVTNLKFSNNAGKNKEEKDKTTLNLKKATNNNGDTPPEESWDSKWLKEVGSLNYSEHLLLFMLIFGTEEDYLNRLKDLIQMEGVYQVRVGKTQLSERVSGVYSTFDIENAYTTIRIDMRGSLSSILPIPTFNGEGTSSLNLPFNYHRVIYRGY